MSVHATETTSVLKEGKADKFRRIAAPRIDAARHRISQLEGMASGQYEFTQDQIDKIFATLEADLQRAKQLFETQLRRRERVEPDKFEL